MRDAARMLESGWLLLDEVRLFRVLLKSTTMFERLTFAGGASCRAHAVEELYALVNSLGETTNVLERLG